MEKGIIIKERKPKDFTDTFVILNPEFGEYSKASNDVYKKMLAEAALASEIELEKE